VSEIEYVFVQPRQSGKTRVKEIMQLFEHGLIGRTRALEELIGKGMGVPVELLGEMPPREPQWVKEERDRNQL
jgi:hypothetical protein